MKIGIMTVSRVDNNGTDLQALAMQKLFKNFDKFSIHSLTMSY